MHDIDNYVDSVEDHLKPVVEKLISIVRSVSADLDETLKWNVPTYSLNNNICSIMAHKHQVNLQVFRGADIKDSAMLDGSGKSMRHLKFEKLADINTSDVKKIIKQAIAIDSA